MLGMMMHRPLRIIDILQFAGEVNGAGRLVSATVEGGLHRTDYGETLTRVERLALALRRQGIGLGDRVATLAWNGYRHFELYYAISALGAVCHTINPRLSAEQMTYIIGHAEDRILCLDLTFAPLVAKLRDQLPKDLTLVVMTDRAHMPASLPGALCYEDLLDAESPGIDWPEFDENTASSLCYTSGTTGNPKGALYSHRSTVLHALMVGVSMQGKMRAENTFLPVVPMFHVNAWGLPYAAPMVGAGLVFPGPRLDGTSLFDMIEAENVTSSWGVPTVWMGLLAEINKRGRIPKGLKEVVIGGSAAPPAMIRRFEELGVSVCHAWGMTEMSPIGTVGYLTPPLTTLPQEERIALKSTQGRRCFGVELKIVDEAGNRLPHDGTSTGELFVRGNAIVSGYFGNQEATDAAIDADGWFGTGDVASLDAGGFLRVTDRAKDLIKSGGEWISSIDVENLAMAHPSVANAAVIAVPHPKWDERPLLVVALAEDAALDRDAIRAHLATGFANWQLPDDIVAVEALPLTATGKVSKLTLRQQFADHVLPDLHEDRA